MLSFITWRLDIAYKGTHFAGFQIQENKNTIQGELERILAILFKKRIVVNGSGRTDAGVHALRQVVSFKTPFSEDIDKECILRALQGLVRGDISILSLQQVQDEFHSRFNTIGKTYVYAVYLGELNNPFLNSLCWQYSYPIDRNKLVSLCKILEGEHNFLNFCVDGKKYKEKSTIRNLHRCQVEIKGDYVFFSFSGTGFLYKMVRVLVAHILDSAGERGVADTEKLFEQNYKGMVTKEVAGARGLFLANVFYSLKDYHNSLDISALDYLENFGLSF